MLQIFSQLAVKIKEEKDSASSYVSVACPSPPGCYSPPLRCTMSFPPDSWITGEVTGTITASQLTDRPPVANPLQALFISKYLCGVQKSLVFWFIVELSFLYILF